MAHRSPELGIVHEIGHMIKDTNLLRADNGKPPFPTDDSYLAASDTEVLSGILDLWSERFDRQLKKSFWWPLALCESGGNWAMKGKYHGGFSFHPLTWKEYRSKRLPKYAWQATPGEQIRVARKVQAAQGWEAWPYCSKKIGLR
ncbi:MAG: transglycosylase family protein [Gaiellales bacterium]